jgi:hypothetical protein
MIVKLQHLKTMYTLKCHLKTNTIHFVPVIIQFIICRPQVIGGNKIVLQ